MTFSQVNKGDDNMRANSIKHLVRLYSIFFIRRVLNFGILKNPLIRVLLLTSLLVLMTVITFSVLTFFSEMLQTEEIVLFLLNTYSSTIILWTIVVTIFLKVVFSKVDGFLRMTINFPISSKERNFSVFLYETLISFVVISLLSFSVVLSMVLIHKLAFVDVLIVNLLYVSTFTYLLLQLLSKVISFVCYFFGIQKIFHIINISALTFTFAMFLGKAQTLVTNLSNDFVQGTNKTNSFLLFFQQTLLEHGFMITTLLYLGLVIVLVGLIIVIPDQSHMSNSKNVLIIDSRVISVPKGYLLSTFRNVNTLNTIALVYLTVAFLIIFDLSDYIIYPIVILAFNSIYSFIQAQNIRLMMYKLSYIAWKDYLYLITSQLITIYLVSIPIFLLGLLTIQSYIHLFIPYLAATLGVFIFVLAGILFPPYNDNPFSVITSIAVVTIPILVIGISLSFLNLGLVINIVFLGFFYIVTMMFSIEGLNNLERTYKNEKIANIY